MLLQQLLLSIVTLSLLFSPWQAPAAKSYSADRFDVDIAVQEDGTLLVTERLTLRFVGGPFTYVFRHLEPERTDGIDRISASVDGVAYVVGDATGQVEITGRDPIKVKWHLPETTDAVHTFELSYRVRGVVRQESGADLLAWQALPNDHEYTIDASTVRVTYPETVALIGDPEIWSGVATLERDTSSVTFAARNLAPDENLTVAMRFEYGSLITAPPHWQARSETIAQRGPTFAFAGAGLLVFGILLLVIRQSRFHRPAARDSVVVSSPPSDVPPAIAGVLANRGSLEATWAYALGTCFDLARRGVIAIEEPQRSSRWQARDFVFRLQTPSADLAPHERGLVNAFFRDKSGIRAEVRLSRLQRTLYQRLKYFSTPLKMECETLGLFDGARQRARNALLVWGVVFLVLGVAGGVVTAFLSNTLGIWPLFVAGALFVFAIVAMIVGASTSTLTDERYQEALNWKRFSKYLWQVTRRRESLTHATQFEAYLSYAAAFGLAQPWANYLKKHEDVEIPPWFRTFAHAADGGRGAFVAMMAASSSVGGTSGTGAAGVAGAGAAGGGASGAG